ncbi:YesL family protein [Aquibacillus albus]|uniref:Membrane protein YesL n=1 Tax=Aquibacillus albus TaxID=1168171 RepID=A0ABS2N5Z0_9BACI|nr:DUF624 domain-containing protein [Aquibacillus albus]MBM7573551.1 putative membrane protein YesL [Aquibacillus albus]
MELTGIIGGFYKISVWITRFAAVNLLWFIFNFPVFFFVYNLLLVETINELVVTVIILSVITPFIFFPATTAMFAVMRKWVMGEDIKLASSYWKYYKEEYKKSVIGGMVIGCFWLLLAIDYYFYINASQSKLFIAFFILLAFILAVFTLHFFSIIVHAQTKLFSAFKNAMYITIGSPILTIEIGLISGLILYFSFHGVAFLIPFFIGAIIAFVSFAGFLRFYSKVQTKH